MRNRARGASTSRRWTETKPPRCSPPLCLGRPPRTRRHNWVTSPVSSGRWPLLLGLAAAHLRRQVYGGVPLADALRDLAARFAAKGVTAFDHRHADLLDASDPCQRDRAVAVAVEASLGLLPPDDQACYRELAVFPPGQPIPASVIADLWAPALDRYDIDDLLSMLADLSLLSLDWSTRLVRVHDLLRDYLLPADPAAAAALHRQSAAQLGRPAAAAGQLPDPLVCLPPRHRR